MMKNNDLEPQKFIMYDTCPRFEFPLAFNKEKKKVFALVRKKFFGKDDIEKLLFCITENMPLIIYLKFTDRLKSIADMQKYNLCYYDRETDTHNINPEFFKKK